MATTRTNMRPLGMVLVQQGVITADELETALVEQAEVGGLLGEVLIRQGLASRPEITWALAHQFGIELDAEDGFGSGLRSQIQQRHEARRNRKPRSATATARDRAEQTEAPPDPRLADPSAAGSTADPGDNGSAPADAAQAPPDAERIEFLLTLVAERDAAVADLSRELDAAGDLQAVVADERARSAELAATLEALERELESDREVGVDRAQQLAQLERELEDARTDDTAAELRAALEQERARTEALTAELGDERATFGELRRAATELERAVADAQSERAQLSHELAERPTAEAARELEQALEQERARAEERERALAGEADLDRARAERLTADLESRHRELEALRDDAAARQIALGAAQQEVRQLEAELLDRPTHESVAKLRKALDHNEEAAELRTALEQQRARSEELAAVWEDERAQLKDVRDSTEELKRTLADAREQLAQREGELEALETLKASLAEADERERALTAERDAERERAVNLATKLSGRDGELDVLRRTAAELETELSERPTHAATEQLRETLEQHTDEIAELRSALGEERSRGEQLAAALDTERDEHTRAREQLAQGESELGALKRAAAEHEQGLTTSRDEAGRLEAELAVTGEKLAELAGALEQADARERMLEAERDTDRENATNLAAKLDEREQELGAQRRADAERQETLDAAYEEITSLRAERDALPTSDIVAALEAAVREAGEREQALVSERDEERSRAAELGEQRARADQLSAELDRERAELQQLRRENGEHLEKLAVALQTSSRLEAELAARPSADTLAELQASIEGHRVRAAAREEELEAVREHGRARTADLEAALCTQRGTADELAATLYDERVRLEALRASEVEHTEALAAAQRELEVLRSALEKRPTEEALTQLRDAATQERTLREKLTSELAADRTRIELLEASITEYHQRADRLRTALESVREAGELLGSVGFDVPETG